MKQLLKNKHWEIDKDYNINKILYLLIDRPDYIDSYNIFYWENKQKQYHRDYDLPFFIGFEGYIEWRKNTKILKNLSYDGHKKLF